MGMQFLVEDISASDSNIITETKLDKSGNVWIHGVFMQSEIKNRNGRIYPMNEMVTAVSEAASQIKDCGGIFGELDHPQSITINMDRISHAITELYMNGNNVMGKAKILDTPTGEILKAIAKSGVKFGVSSRGAGLVKDGGIVEGFKLVTIDAVATPSCSSALPSTMYEALEDTILGKRVMTLAESLQQDASAQKYFKIEMRKFIDKMFTK